MDLLIVAIPVAVVIALVLLKQLTQLSAAAAAEHLRQGARIVDVRSPAEFQEKHLPNAINIPLGDLKDLAPEKLPDKERVLLLHCLSGGRSAMGMRVLKGMGYRHVFNLGSYSRASRIVDSVQPGERT